VTFGLKGEPWKGEVKGTFLLRRNGVFYKVITVRRIKDCWWIFYCVNIESKQKRVLKYKLLGMLEVLDNAASKLKDPQGYFANRFRQPRQMQNHDQGPNR